MAAVFRRRMLMFIAACNYRLLTLRAALHGAGTRRGKAILTAGGEWTLFPSGGIVSSTVSHTGNARAEEIVLRQKWRHVGRVKLSGTYIIVVY